jgi:hypothetical protein
MTFPVRGLPSTDQIEDLRFARQPYKSAAFTSGGSEMDLTDPANGCTP